VRLNIDALHELALSYPDASGEHTVISPYRGCGMTILQMCHALNKLCFVMTVIVTYKYEHDLTYMVDMMADLAEQYQFERIRYYKNIRVLRMQTDKKEQKVVRFVRNDRLREAMSGLDRNEVDVQSLVDYE